MSILERNAPWAGLVALFLLSACDVASDEAALANGTPNADARPVLQVYKSPTCNCCGRWMAHVEGGDFETIARHPDDLNAVKDRLGIATPYRSCHTAVSESGYIFEGHVPVRHIRDFLADPPEGALGLSVSGMPVGSPGMEVGDRFTPYRVLLLGRDGSSSVYAEVARP